MPVSNPPIVFTPPSAGSPPAAPEDVFDPAGAVAARVRECVTLSGATGAQAANLNKAHYVTGVYGGKKCFGGTQSAPVIGWDGTRWEIYPFSAPGAAYIAGTGDVPADGTWTNVLTEGTIVGAYTAPVAGYDAPPEVFTP
jgi:hypothetical protein